MGPAVDNIAAARILIKILKYIGLWQWQSVHDTTASAPQQQQQQEQPQWTLVRLLQHYFGYLLHLPLTFTYITLMWVEAFTSHDLAQAGDVMYMSLTEVALIVKILTIWHFSEEACQYMHEMATSAQFTLHTEEEREMWRIEQHNFGRVRSFYLIGCSGVMAFAFFGVLLLSSYQLPFAFWVPFEWRNADNYWYAYAYELLAMNMTCLANASLDLIYCYFMFHVALLYKLLGVRLAALQHMAEEKAVQQLEGIFQLHHNVKRLTLQCERLVSAPVLSQIILSALILCFSGYRLQNMNIMENLGQFISMLQFVSVMILEIYLPCYYANEITINSNYLTTSIYTSNWLQFSVPTRRIIYQYMEFLKRPAKIKSGNFFEVGLPIFTKTINNAYSLFAVLLNTDKK